MLTSVGEPPNNLKTDNIHRTSGVLFACTYCNFSCDSAFHIKTHLKRLHPDRLIDFKEIKCVNGKFREMLVSIDIKTGLDDVSLMSSDQKLELLDGLKITKESRNLMENIRENYDRIQANKRKPKVEINDQHSEEKDDSFTCIATLESLPDKLEGNMDSKHDVNSNAFAIQDYEDISDGEINEVNTGYQTKKTINDDAKVDHISESETEQISDRERDDSLGENKEEERETDERNDDLPKTESTPEDAVIDHISESETEPVSGEERDGL